MCINKLNKHTQTRKKAAYFKDYRLERLGLWKSFGSLNTARQEFLKL